MIPGPASALAGGGFPRSAPAGRTAVSSLLAREAEGLCRVALAPAGGEPRELSGLVGSSAALAVAALASGPLSGRPAALVVLPSTEAADEFADDLRYFLGADGVHLFPAFDPAGGASGGRPDFETFSARLSAMRALRDARPGQGRPALVAAPLLAVVQLAPPPDEMEAAVLALALGQTVDRDAIGGRLAESGFERVGMVGSPGEFSVRGMIVDVFPFAEEYPCRIELEGDAVESIRRFDPGTQLSIAELPGVSLPLLSKSRFAPEKSDENAPSILDHLPPGSLLFLREPREIDERAARLSAEEEMAWVAARHARLNEFARASGAIALREEAAGGGAASVSFVTRPVDSRGREIDDAIATVSGLAEIHERVAVVCRSEGERARFASILGEREIGASERISVTLGDLSTGFSFPSLSLALVPHHELFRLHRQRRPSPRFRHAQPIEDFLELEEGDSVVHVAHGVAKYRGIERIEEEGRSADFLVLEFRDSVKLFVPVTKIELVQKYVGVKGRAPLLDKLGGTTWSKKKKRVEKALRDFAAELLEVQAIREKRSGISYPRDSEWQHEFEAAFPYEDTPDQAEATVRIKEDMERLRPMDRLVCGDVGYGKTELAMRAAFKAIDFGKQVAVLVPTTVLAQQHFETFNERMRAYPVVIEVISRFRTRRDQKDVLERTAAGSVDLLIGTHRLLQNDVRFQDLGLVIVDEEQRFGVEHKHQLKRLRSTVDCLTLTATPIPRTLHMALLGLRDISSLATPPRGRQAIETVVTPREESLVREAILRELDRDGQVFFVHNRVQTIERERKALEALVPEARFAVVHGQMPEHLVEERMVDFIEKRVDVLLATTIIESGLDIPNANTMFIDRADRFGLAELHQLRGRVGRYTRKAHSYLLTPKNLPMSEIALRRLRAIEEYNDLGAGFRIAMKDLEIRGAGNILGAEQHGHIADVGYDLYCRLLAKTAKLLRAEPVAEDFEVDIDLTVDSYVPDSYVSDLRVKMDVYRRIATVESPDGFAPLLAHLRDRFGEPPQPVREIVALSRLKLFCRRIGVARVSRGEKGMLVLQCRSEGAAVRLVSREERGTRSRARLVEGPIVHFVLLRALLTAEEIAAELIAHFAPLAGDAPRAAPPEPPAARTDAAAERSPL